MSINTSVYQQIRSEAEQNGALLVAVSKTKPVEDILALYNMGHRDFGENYVQELTEKAAQLPQDIHWHFIGHLQRNKVKYIAPFVTLIHGVDSFRLLEEIGKQADKLQRGIDCLLQVHIATEETKFGLDEIELLQCWQAVRAARVEGKLSHVRIRGLMGMASFSSNEEQVRKEFQRLHQIYRQYKQDFVKEGGEPVLSMGMSADYRIALEEGGSLIRIGSLLFGTREK